jgi:hypothetical protein
VGIRTQAVSLADVNHTTGGQSRELVGQSDRQAIDLKKQFAGNGENISPNRNWLPASKTAKKIIRTFKQ